MFSKKNITFVVGNKRKNVMLTKYGTDNIIVMLIIGGILIFSPLFVSNNYLSITFFTLGLLLIMFTFWFFRDPDRKVPEEAKTDTSLVLSPADGKVVEIVEEDENYYLKDKVRRISIFLSPLDVHVNRVPATGEIEFYDYNPGKYLVAYHPKSSELNEQSRIGLRSPHGKIFFKQIVGIVARRLVCELKVGDKVNAGDKFGMMKFGSRMDVMVPLDAEVLVKVGDRVKACETIISKLI
ncbi:MAG TPA: phosphatidylserine decarboxylase family protein [Candidatus Kapabacteria bacterium]|jgi:phosphatidylserine decarboxylase|nr:phosphatidylserine decarboxylase family protein [Candidatus Kapabacteria bacterium]HOM05290.1 phosphatidylserine decarboxylase family protein [Candidatus Kapabacteria bacterium]